MSFFRELKPNTIVFTGEIIDRAENLALLELFLAALGPTPRVAVLGNWEYWSTVDLQRLRKIGLNLTDLTHWVQQHFGLRAGSGADARPADNARATEWLESSRRQVGEALHLPTLNR
jgi:predicted MPP superfamily phosphohydrolase